MSSFFAGLALLALASGCGEGPLEGLGGTEQRLGATPKAPSAYAVRLAAARATLQKLAADSQQALRPSYASPAKTLRKLGKRAVVRFSRFGTLRHLHASKPLFSAAGAKSPEAQARAFLTANPGLLGLLPSDQLVFRSVTKRAAGAGLYVRFYQRHDGVDVEGSGLTVLIDAQGRVDGLLSQLVPNITKSAQPAVLAQSTGAVLKAGDTAVGTPTLVYAELMGAFELCWRAKVKDAAGVPHHVWVSAETGALVRRASLRRHALGVDEVRVEDAGVTKRKEPDFYCYCCTPDPRDPGLCAGCPCMQNGTNGSLLQPIWDTSAAASQYLDVQFSRDGWKGNGTYFSSNLVTGYDNAHFDPDSEDVTVGGSFATADVVAHEWGHGLHFAEGTATSDHTQARSVAEGLADVFSKVISRNDWCLGDLNNSCGRYLKDPFYGQCGGPGQATSYRRWCFDEDETISDGSQTYFNASLVAHPFYLAAVSDDPPPSDCRYDQECRDAAQDWSNTEISCGCEDGAGTCERYVGDKPRVCLVTKNGVRVPFRGRDLAYLPYYYATTSGALGADPKLRHVYDAVVQAARDWDVNNGHDDADYLTKSTERALLAAGHWTTAGIGSDPDNNAQAWHRPAMLSNVFPSRETCSASSPCEGGRPCEAGFCTTENWTHMFVAQPDDGSEPGQIMMRGSVNGVAWSADNTLYFDGSPQEAGSGISVARDPRLLEQLSAAMVFKRRDDDRIQYATAVLTESSAPSWSLGEAFGETDATPAIAFYNGTFVVVWKQAGSEQLVYGSANEQFQAITDIPDAESTNAPTLTVANGRLWLFFTASTGAPGWEGAYRIRYTSYNGSTWEPVRDLGQVEPERLPVSSFAPEAKTYGVPGAERVWLFFVRYGSVRMFTFVPPAFSASADLSQLSSYYRDPPIPLLGTQAPSDSDHAPWMSVFESDGDLHVYYKHAETLDAWQTAKRGDG